jgi:hypothetical protein
MMIKTLNVTLGVVVALSVGCAAALYAFMAMRMVVMGVAAAYHLVNS